MVTDRRSLLLFLVDSRPFQTAVDQADAKLRLAESQLSQARLCPAQTTLAQIRHGRLLTYVRLYKALGGGWSLSDTEWSGPSGS